MAEETNAREYVPIYYESPERAYRDSVTGPEADAFRASFSATEKCVNDIQAAITQNREAAGKFSSTDFVEGLLDTHGKDRVEYVLASYIRSRENESAYFSDDVKAWAHGIRISDSYMIANTIIIAGGDDMVNALAEEMRVRGAEAAYIAAKEGDTSAKEPEGNGPEKENAAEAPSEPETEAVEDAHADGPREDGRVVKNDDGSVTVRMPEDAVIRMYQTSAVLCMPRGRGYDMFRYMVDIKAFRENGDGTVSVTVGTNDSRNLTIRRRGQEVKLSAEKIYDVFSGAGVGDYIPQKYSVEIPADAVQGNYPNMIRCRFPDDSVYQGQHVVIPSIFKDEILSNDEKVVFSIPDYMNFSVRNTGGDDMLIPVSEVAREVEGGTYKKKTLWTHVDMPGEAMLHVYDKHTLFKMPEGSYSGFVYYLPNGMAPLDKDGTIKVRIPDERKIQIKNGVTGQKEELTTLQWANLVSGKIAADYAVKREGGENAGDKEFLDRAEKIRSVIPPEMLEEKSWIAVRVRQAEKKEDGEAARPQKFAVSPDAAKSAAEAMYRNIGTDYDSAVEAGRGMGASVMGFCFSKDSDVVCLELDNCLDSTGAPATEKAKEITESFDGTYMEKSVSGKGLHVFGKMSDPKIEALSRDGDIEMFSSSGYIAVTGVVVKSPRALAPLDEGEKKAFMEKNFDEAKEIPKPTAADEKLVKKAMDGQSGQDFEVLYEGGNIRGGKEFCDMSLAMRLSCAAGGDEKTVERLYNASKRDPLDSETLTHIAKRAVNATEDVVRKGRAAARDTEKAEKDVKAKDSSDVRSM